MSSHARACKSKYLLNRRFARDTTIKLRAERRAGELLREMAERGERRDGSNKQNLRRSHAETPVAPKLSDLGLTKSQSS
jgi:hypothetical protein